MQELDRGWRSSELLVVAHPVWVARSGRGIDDDDDDDDDDADDAFSSSSSLAVERQIAF